MDAIDDTLHKMTLKTYRQTSTNSTDSDRSDRTDHGQPSSGPTLEQSMEECCQVIELCIRNQFVKAIEMCDKWSETSLYHSHGKSLLLFLKAVLTLEPPEVRIAMEACNKTNDLCQKLRKSQSITNSVSKYIWKQNYNDYTEEEIHAELVNAENLLIIALLTFFSDQNIMSLVRGAFRIRSCHSTYKFCLEISEHKTEWKSETSRAHFMSGVLLGNGALNLVFSHLPKRVLKILELIGFSGDRASGMKSLDKCCNDQSGLRYFPAQLVVLGYETYVVNTFGARKPNCEYVQKFVDKGLELYDQSSWFLWFNARILQLRGDIENAIICFNKCIESQNELQPMHNICFWELLWCHAVKFEWDSAAEYAQILTDQCNWSAATFTYQKATFLYMKMIEDNKPEMHDEVSRLFKLVPTLKVRLAGKTIPPEKYVCVKAVKYFTQNESLVLPVFELFYIWNTFSIIDENPKLIEPIFLRINKTIPKYINEKDSVNAIENYLLLLLLKGICHKILKEYKFAEKCFNEIIKNEKHIKTDKHLLPMASLEMGLTKLDANSYTEAKHWLKKAKNEYSGYLFETMIHFRAHSAIQRVKLILKSEKLN